MAIQPPRAYQRSPHLVAYWVEDGRVLHDYARGESLACDAATFDLLDFFGRPRTLAQLIASRPQFSPLSLRRAVKRLFRHGLLIHPRAGSTKDDVWRQWESWSPAASFFHFSTKDVAFTNDQEAVRHWLRREASASSGSPRIKRYRKSPQFQLPVPKQDGDFSRVLLERRTWRRFGKGAIELADLSTLLGLTAGVRWWVNVPAIGKVALKTSPSAGALHPLECYVAARRVRGLPAGIYHYAADVHRLELNRRGMTARRLAAWLPGQKYYADTAALCVFTAVFRRPQWKYRFARAYRTVLLDAGHIGQTFCLVATSLELAPFCTAALADSRIERDLGIDGVGESVVYVAGVGTRPHGVDWAPMSSGKSLRRVWNPL